MNIDLYHHGKIGGRLATSVLRGREYEVGGSIIHPDNEYMVNFTSILGESIIQWYSVLRIPLKLKTKYCSIVRYIFNILWLLMLL